MKAKVKHVTIKALTKFSQGPILYLTRIKKQRKKRFEKKKRAGGLKKKQRLFTRSSAPSALRQLQNRAMPKEAKPKALWLVGWFDFGLVLCCAHCATQTKYLVEYSSNSISLCLKWKKKKKKLKLAIDGFPRAKYKASGFRS